MDEKSGETKKTTDFWGNTKEEHSDSSGKKIGETRFTTDFFGGSKQEHYDSEGRKVGETKRGSDWLGGDQAEHYDADGKRIGTSQNETDWSGRSVQRHYDASGKQVGTTERASDWFGNSKKEHTGEWFKGRSSIGSDPERSGGSRGEYSGGSGTGVLGDTTSSPISITTWVLSALGLLMGVIGLVIGVAIWVVWRRRKAGRYDDPTIVELQVLNEMTPGTSPENLKRFLKLTEELALKATRARIKARAVQMAVQMAVARAATAEQKEREIVAALTGSSVQQPPPAPRQPTELAAASTRQRQPAEPAPTPPAPEDKKESDPQEVLWDQRLALQANRTAAALRENALVLARLTTAEIGLDTTLLNQEVKRKEQEVHRLSLEEMSLSHQVQVENVPPGPRSEGRQQWRPATEEPPTQAAIDAARQKGVNARTSSQDEARGIARTLRTMQEKKAFWEGRGVSSTAPAPNPEAGNKVSPGAVVETATGTKQGAGS